VSSIRGGKPGAAARGGGSDEMKIDKRKSRTIEEGAVLDAAEEVAAGTPDETPADVDEQQAQGEAVEPTLVEQLEALRQTLGDGVEPDADEAAGERASREPAGERSEGAASGASAGGSAASADEADDIAELASGGTGLWPVERLKPVLEAVIFAAADPLAVRRMRDVVEGATAVEIKAAIAALQEDYAPRGIRLVEVAGGWQIRTAPEHHDVVRRLFKERPFRLSRAAIETLAVIAYRQPATRAEIETIRGVDASGVIEGLVERKLVKVAGRRDVPGRPLVYATTQEFLETFGLKDLKSLPTLPELGDELASMAEQSGFTDAPDRDAAILPLEEGEESSGNDDEAARTAERADRSDEDGDREGRGQDEEEHSDEAGRLAEAGRRDIRKGGRRIRRSRESQEDDAGAQAAPADRP
jgi:segregation and condensation protein B